MRQHPDSTCGARMAAVLAYIQSNLDAPLTLDDLASMAGFSPYHFHRLFADATGETIMRHIRRMRLERAAFRLIYSGRPVTDVALEAGYASLEAFSRAFKDHYGQSPRDFREYVRQVYQSVVGLLLPGRSTNEEAGSSVVRDPIVTIRRKPPLFVACARAVGPYEQTSAYAWAKLAAWSCPRGLLRPDAIHIGMLHDDPSLAPSERLRFDACLAVGPEVAPEGDIGVMHIPGGEYAVTVHNGPIEELGKTYTRLFGQWLPETGREPAPRPSYYVCRTDPRSAPSGEMRLEVHVSLESGHDAADSWSRIFCRDLLESRGNRRGGALIRKALTAVLAAQKESP
jgi:AraC family transcriptional regulator